MKKYKSIFNKLWLLIGLIPLIASCTNSIDATRKEGEGKIIKLELQALLSNTSQLDGGQVDPELRIDNVIALVFDEENTFAYKAVASQPIFNAKTNKYEIELSLFESENREKYSISLLTNIEDNYGNLRRMKGKPKKQILESFTFSSSISDTNDYPLGKSDLKIPMYGETEHKEITDNLKFDKTISLMRAVSKVDFFMDVAVMDIKSNQKFENGTAVNYTLNSVYLHNSVKKGRVAPMFNNSEAWSTFIPTEPSLVLSNNEPLLNPLFKYAEYATSKSTLSKPVFVQENKGGDKLDDNVTLFIVGLAKKGSTDVRYYRVDIPEIGAPTLLTDLIRNQYYKVHIKDVDGEGASTPDEAVVSKDVCSANLEIAEWTIKSYPKKLIGEEYFDISKRDVAFTSKGIAELTFKTNIDDVTLRWLNDKPSVAKQKEIRTDYYNVKVVREENSGTGKLVIEALKDTRSRFNIIWDEFNVFVGNMVIPIKIDQEKTRLVLPLNNFEGSSLTQGYFTLNKPIEVGSNSFALEFNASSKFTGLKDPDGGKGTFDFDVDLNIGDRIHIRSLSNSSGVTINLQDYKLEYKDFKFIHQADGTWKKVISILAPISGRPAKLGLNTVPYSIEVYYKGGILDLKEKTTTALKNLDMNFNVYSVAPLSTIEPNILIVGNSYSFDLNVVGAILSNDWNINLAKLLFNKVNFGLETNSKVKVEPFVYEFGKYDVVKNITRVSSLSSINNPNELDDYNIIIYLDSKTPNEIAFKESAYVKKIVSLIKAKKIIFIQTPSYSDRFSAVATEIEDPILSQVVGQSVMASQSSNSTQYSLAVTMKALMAGQTNLSVYYPSRDEESFFKWLNPNANFRDITYLGNVSYSDTQAISSHSLNGRKPIAFKSSAYYYLWLGSSFLFEDRAVGVNSSSLPTDLRSRTYEGLSRPTTEQTNNSTLFINMLEWAIVNLKNLK